MKVKSNNSIWLLLFIEENMVPAIFQEMEKAEDSEGFDSCDDEEQPSESKRTGNPFQDFNLDIATIEKEDPDLASKCESS